MPLRDKYCASNGESCTKVVKVKRQNRRARRRSRQRNVSELEVPDRRRTLTQAPESEVGRGRQEIFVIGKIDSKVWRMTWLLGFRKIVLLHKLEDDYYIVIYSIQLPLSSFTFTGESDILRGSWPACEFHWTAQLLWEKEVKWDEEECWLTQISRLPSVVVIGWGVSRQLVHEGG